MKNLTDFCKTVEIGMNPCLCRTKSKGNDVKSTPIYCGGFISIGEAYRSKIMSRFAINIYSPVNLKKTFSTLFLLNYQHIIQRLGSFCMCKRNKLSIISLAMQVNVYWPFFSFYV